MPTYELHPKAASFAEIAEYAGKVERHIRFLVPLAFVSPSLIEAMPKKPSATFNARLETVKIVA